MSENLILIEQYLSFHKIIYLVLSLFFSSFLVVFFITFKKVIKCKKVEGDTYLFLFLSSCMIFPLSLCLFELFQIIVTPDLYLQSTSLKIPAIENYSSIILEQRFIYHKFVLSLFTPILFSPLLIMSILYYTKNIRYKEEDDNITGLLLFSSLIFGIPLLISIYHLGFIFMAPDLYKASM